MIIACPACGTKYVVPDDALGVEGRTVRCAKCKHSWFQDGPAADLPVRGDEVSIAVTPRASTEQVAKTGSAPADVTTTPPDSLAERTASGEPSVEAEPAVAAPVVPLSPKSRKAPSAPADKPVGEAGDAPLPDAALKPPPFYRASDHPPAAQRKPKDRSAGGGPADAGYSSFDYQPPFRPSRNRLRLLTFGAAAFAALALTAIAAIQYWGLPSWLPFPQPGFAAEEPDLTLSFPQPRNQTRTLPNGSEFLAISGTITNTGRETRSVPPILLVLRDERNRVVYSQEIAPPASELAPGETREVNEAIADVPRSAINAEFGWALR